MKKHFYSCCQLALLVAVVGCLGACKNNSNSSSSGGGNSEEGNETLPYDNGNRFLYPNTQIQRFDYNGVKISNDSPFRQEFNYALDFLLTIPTDDFLKNMRVREGMDVPGSTYLGGWYSDPNIWIAATFGQYVSSLARGYAITGDLRYKQKATELIDGWADTITKDGPNKGYFYFNMKYEKESNSTHYTFDKAVLMCLDVYTYIGGEVGQRALGYLEQIVDFAIPYLGQDRHNADSIRHSGQTFSNESEKGADIEWYTVSENLYRAYLATGDQKYRDYADVWNYDFFWENISNSLEDSSLASYFSSVHAYSHINSLSGLGARGIVYNDEDSMDALARTYDYMQMVECYPNGFYGSGERLIGNRGNRNSAINGNTANAEVPCNGWAALKISKYLTEMYGSACYQDWAEKILNNGVLGSLRLKNDATRRGITFYYANYQNNATKDYYGASWPCCSGTYFLDLCDSIDHLYFKDENSLYVANYTSSEVTNNYKGYNVTLHVDANTYENSVVNMEVKCTNKVDFNLKLRNPTYSPIKTIKVNGQPITVENDADNWVLVGSSFKNGDKIEIEFDYTLRLDYIEDGVDSGMMAMYGSYYMVAENAPSVKIYLADGKDIDEYVIGYGEDEIYVKDERDKLFTFRPFYKLGEGAQYAGNLALVRV